MSQEYLTYLSALASEKLSQKAEFDCWKIGLCIQTKQSIATFESVPFFIEKGPFHFGFYQFQISHFNEILSVIKDSLLHDYYIIGWKRQSRYRLCEEDSYLIFGCNEGRKILNILMFDGLEPKKVEVSFAEYKDVFLNQRYHRKSGKMPLFSIKENKIWNDMESRKRVEEMIKRYLRGESIWGTNRKNCYYGIQAKRMIWEQENCKNLIHAQSECIAQLLAHSEDISLNQKYRKIDWKDSEAFEQEEKFLVDFIS